MLYEGPNDFIEIYNQRYIGFLLAVNEPRCGYVYVYTCNEIIHDTVWYKATMHRNGKDDAETL